jgi:peptide-methionine (S)-S-oxide reductase
VVRTRVGYAGGQQPSPTYLNLGGHSETIQIDYDPTQITYEELLDVYWESHNPTSPPWSRQYASVIFYHDEQQKRLATETKDREAARYGNEVYTEVRPFSEFYLAEGYHQKYRLQQVPEFMEAFQAIYPDEKDFLNSTAAARVNGLAGGHGTLATLQAEIDSLGLSQEESARLLETLTALERKRD